MNLHTYRSFRLAAVAVMALGAPLSAAFYDDFADGHYWADPNDEPFTEEIGWFPLFNNPGFDPSLWDVDNPQWEIRGVIGSTFYADAGDGWLRLYGTIATVTPHAFISATVNDGIEDPNLSVSAFDDTAPHYVLSKVKIYDTEKGEIIVLLQGDYDYWTAYGLSREEDSEDLDVYYIEGLDWEGYQDHHRPDLDEVNGYWLAFQFVGDGDPNNSYLRGAAWNGEKFDWNGAWDIDFHILTVFDPNEIPYLDVGSSAVATLAGPENGGGLDCDAKFDQIECRWGTFGNIGRSLTLEVSHPENGTVTIDPDLLLDPNNKSPDPNLPTDPNEPRIYTDGTEIMLVANPDPNGKGFNKWEVIDPADANNNYSDTNTVLYLTMDRDWEVKAKFACGSAALMPILALTLACLGTAALLRRVF